MSEKLDKIRFILQNDSSSELEKEKAIYDIMTLP